ncbi:uncharacterized protein [Equus przewalskii]|uniref:Uncharacterized protein n=1 Tax=Equus przewalskii TaxID=9798 RepID=A0ABM4QGG5_EQUPR
MRTGPEDLKPLSFRLGHLVIIYLHLGPAALRVPRSRGCTPPEGGTLPPRPRKCELFSVRGSEAPPRCLEIWSVISWSVLAEPLGRCRGEGKGCRRVRTGGVQTTLPRRWCSALPPERVANDGPGGAFPAVLGGASAIAAAGHPSGSGGWLDHDHVDWSAARWPLLCGRAGKESDVAEATAAPGASRAPWPPLHSPGTVPPTVGQLPSRLVSARRRRDRAFAQASAPALRRCGPEGGGLRPVSLRHHFLAGLRAQHAARDDPAQAEPSGPALVARLSGFRSALQVPGRWRRRQHR